MTGDAGKLATVFGGSGFAGTQVVQELARRGYRIRVAVRRPDLAGHVKPLGSVGQIQPVQANVRNMASVQRAAAGADVVINLAGIGYERGRQRFRAVNAMGAKNVAQAAMEAGAKTLVHISALGADADAESGYERSKGLGEAEVLGAFPEAVILRPAAMFGADDSFFNRFGLIVRLSPVLPLIHGGTRLQPVYAGDVAEAAARAADGAVRGGKIYELGGPEVATMRELMQRLLAETARQRLLLPLPAGLAKFKAFFLQLLPSPLLTVDEVVRLGHDTIVSDAARRQKRTLSGLGVTPTAMEAILPTYLWRFRKHGQFDRVEA